MNLYERLKDCPRRNDQGEKLRAFKRYPGQVGLEIETECEKFYDIPEFKFWKTHVDPSLRGAFNQEYVLIQPVKFKQELDLALEEFNQHSKNIKFIKDSITTSVHVHLNFLNSTFRETGNFITAYALTENLLSHYAGDNRKSNLFCLPIRDAEETYKYCMEFFQNAEKKNYNGLWFNENNLKYAALNLSAFRNFGSLEIRSFRGETNIVVIREWLNILQNLYNYAHTPNRNPKNILLDWKNKGLELLYDIYGDYSKKLTFAGFEQEIESNVWYAASIAYSVKDWIKIDEVVEPKVKKAYTAKELNAASKMLFAVPVAQLDVAQVDHLVDWMDVRDMDFGVQKKPVREVNPFENPVPRPQWNLQAPIDNAVIDRDR